MAKNSTEAYGASGKTNLLMFDPDTLTIITDPAHHLFDARADLPVSEEMVLNILWQGVIEPIVVTKDPETGLVCVVAGRQRVKAAREANRRQREKGCEPVMVPGIIKRGGAAALADVMVSENEIRQGDSALGRAQKMQKLIDLGRDHEQVAVVFGTSAQTVKHTLVLLDAPAAVRNAVENGTINVSTAHKLSKMPADEQRQKVREIIETSAGLKGHKKAQAVRAATGTVKMRGKKEIAAMLEKLPPESTARAVLDWVLGGTDEDFAS